VRVASDASYLVNAFGNELLMRVQTDDELLDYARRYGSTCYHISCTCMIGHHAMTVVDDELGVHGLDGLRVITPR
jgi:choline dehydrogenase